MLHIIRQEVSKTKHANVLDFILPSKINNIKGCCAYLSGEAQQGKLSLNINDDIILFDRYLIHNLFINAPYHKNLSKLKISFHKKVPIDKNSSLRATVLCDSIDGVTELVIILDYD